MIARRVIGFVIATIGVLLGASLTVAMVALLAAFWSAEETGGKEGRAVLIVSATIGVLIGYGIYLLGRRIAR